MAGGKLTPAVEKALSCVKKGISFVLDGGAGSGKTYSLTLLVGEILALDPSKRVACITYTNAAARVIQDRYESPRLRVSTIHDFLWSFIGGFQKELKDCLVALIRDGEFDNILKLDEGHEIDEVIAGIPDSISYREVLRLREGTISHDQVIAVFCKMIEKYEKLARLITDEYPVILVDEYQDTSPDVVNALLRHVAKRPGCMVGFFGDHMQAIYEKGVGTLMPQIRSGELVHVKVEQNRRNSSAVMEFANKLRFDFVQRASDDADAPNMAGGRQIQGSVLVVVGNNSDGMRLIRESRACGSWDEDSRMTWLTRKSVAAEAGYETLLNVHSKDPIVAFARDVRSDHPEVVESDEPFDTVAQRYPLPYKRRNKGYSSRLERLRGEHPKEYRVASSSPFRQLFGHGLDSDALNANPDARGMAPSWCPIVRYARVLCRIVSAYCDGDYSLLADLVPIEIDCVDDKRRLSDAIKEIADAAHLTLGQALEKAFCSRLMSKGDDLSSYEKRYEYVSQELLDIALDEYLCFFRQYDDQTQYSTQHKTKGLEFKNEIVCLSNGGWNSEYDFVGVLSRPPSDIKRILADDPKEGTEAKLAKSARLLYVSATRAIENLILYIDDSDKQYSYEALLQWFDASQIVALKDLLETE